MSSLPEGNNQQGAWQSYDEKTYYKSVSELIGSNTERIDLKDFPLYGKVDERGTQVMLPPSNTLLSSEKLLTLSELEDIPATDIVANSFLVLKERMNFLSIQGIISEDSPYYNMSAEISYLSWETGFEDAMNQIVNDVCNYAIERDRHKPVLNLDDFMNMFQQYVYDSCPYSILTLNEYLVSRFSDPLETGLVVEVSVDDASDDSTKASKYLNDPSFSRFVDEAAYYGFYVDSAVPWRLVLNPKSDYVRSFLAAEGYHSFQRYLDANYISPMDLSFDYYVNLLRSSYKTLVSRSPNISSVSSGEIGTSFELVDRNNPVSALESISSFADKVGIKKLLRMYIYTKIQEKNIFLNKPRFDKLYAESISFKKEDKSLDIQKSLGYIQYQIRKLDSNKKAKSEFRI